MVTHEGKLNGVDYCFFAQSSSLEKAMSEVLAAYAKFKRQVKVFEWFLTRCYTEDFEFLEAHAVVGLVLFLNINWQ